MFLLFWYTCDMKKYIALFIFTLFALTPIAHAQLGVVTTARQFDRNLTIGSYGDDVLDLQKLLNGLGFEVAATGAGSMGNETKYFGGMTKNAVIAFQKDNGVPGTGFVGPLTRAALNTVTAPTVVPPTSKGLFIENTTDTSAEALFLYEGGNEKPEIWFTYGSSENTMSITSDILIGKEGVGIARITLSSLEKDNCYVRAHVKNSAGMTRTPIKKCA